ncbi:hypothetical protein PTRG_06573 [Pyrenophora tritici-repentis Pt-1C-BFP]|uniref:Uncharacterized protein n=1 Tax=Pyrenophora tritici-repentis (strain Pt-1C-BFP) TaxID=426418 RepID=B2W9B5_PYRTR|nr:uncharacterized protein PTRG_06573 [Pyrenophora tritici-repentis Pt-1C-BFP]EDU49493.1 hypothetical protein PTRG_06573 [Pyrenophora tritici-repentis Pt-1C-BFP]
MGGRSSGGTMVNMVQAEGWMAIDRFSGHSAFATTVYTLLNLVYFPSIVRVRDIRVQHTRKGRCDTKEHDRPITKTNHYRLTSRVLEGVLAAHLTMPYGAMHVVATSHNDQAHIGPYGVED